MNTDVRRVYRSGAGRGFAVPAPESVVEVLQTPLSTAYSWSYEASDRRLRKLYQLGKQRNWDAQSAVDWRRPLPRSRAQGGLEQLAHWPEVAHLNRKQRVLLAAHIQAWTLSQLLHGEQGALLVASQLISCAPTHDAKLYASSQAFDEARHVEALSSYVSRRVGFAYPVNGHLKSILDDILTDPRWDLKFIGMQLILEPLALAAFQVLRERTADETLRELLDLIVRDEARHVAFGATYMEEFVSGLSPRERAARAEFAFDACRRARERVVPSDVFERFGLDVAEGRRYYLMAEPMERFGRLLLQRVVPSLEKIGLLPAGMRARYEDLARDGRAGESP